MPDERGNFFKIDPVECVDADAEVSVVAGIRKTPKDGEELAGIFKPSTVRHDPAKSQPALDRRPDDGAEKIRNEKGLASRKPYPFNSDRGTFLNKPHGPGRGEGAGNISRIAMRAVQIAPQARRKQHFIGTKGTRLHESIISNLRVRRVGSSA